MRFQVANTGPDKTCQETHLLMTNNVAVTLDATAVVGAVEDFMIATSPKNSDFPKVSTCSIRAGCSLVYPCTIQKSQKHKCLTGFIDKVVHVQLCTLATTVLVSDECVPAARLPNSVH